MMQLKPSQDLIQFVQIQLPIKYLGIQCFRQQDQLQILSLYFAITILFVKLLISTLYDSLIYYQIFRIYAQYYQSKLYIRLATQFYKHMQGFKNLLPRNLLTDDAFQPLIKKADQHRKTTQISVQHFQLIYRNFETYYSTYEKEVIELLKQITTSENNFPMYFSELVQLFKNISIQLKIFSQKTNGGFKQLTSLCNTLFLDYSNTILNFQQLIRSYQSNEQIIFQLSKKYFRGHKNMIGSIQSYKNSFTDARLIYNNQEKVKRYAVCEVNFKVLTQDLKCIEQKTQKMNEKKNQIKKSYESIDNQMKRTLKVIGSKIITQTKGFVKNFSHFHKTIITFLAQKKFTLQKLQLTSVFCSCQKNKYQDYIKCQIDPLKCRIYPCIIAYHQQIKPQYLAFCKSAFNSYLKDAAEKVQQRKNINKKVSDFVKNYIKILEKTYYLNLKQITSNFQKIKKKLSDLFGGRLVSFLKSTNAIFELSIGIHEKLFKQMSSKVKSIEQAFLQDSKLLDMFLKELKTNIQKFVGKIQSKKSIQEKQGDSFQQQIKPQDQNSYRACIKQKSQFLMHLIDGFQTKMCKTQKQIKQNYNSIVNDISMSINQFYSLCCEYESIYFGDQQFLSNYKKYQTDIDKSLQKESSFYAQNIFKCLLEDKSLIEFENQINKVDEFKKIKKPSQLQDRIRQSMPLNLSATKSNIQRKPSDDAVLPFELEDGNGKSPKLQKQNSTSQSPTMINSSLMKQSYVAGDKYGEFLASKIKFFQGQQFLKSYSCAFYDKIILQGRIYLTTYRLCFHSKFNPNNVFFGGTFIQIPKKDIKKIEKRFNALIFDNSISITTVNGEMFFTSFFSRDQAYELLCRNFQINPQDQIFIQQQEGQNDANVVVQEVKQDDDLSEGEQKERGEKINQMLNKFDYQILIQSEFNVGHISAMRFFRLFDSGQEIIINKKAQKSFLQYCKESVGHKEVQVHHFNPNILQYLNSSNIKKTTPLKIQRKLNAMVPISAAGVPFMPKAARSDETQSLFFISKNKYIIQSIIQNSGAPYTDCFSVRLKKTVQSKQENKVSVKIQLYLNFVKSTMMKSMIQSKSIEETKAFFVRTTDQIRKYFKAIQKAKANQSGKNEVSAQIRQEIQNLQKELQQNTTQKQKFQQQVKILSSSNTDLKKYLLLSVVLNFLLFLLLISW